MIPFLFYYQNWGNFSLMKLWCPYCYWPPRTHPDHPLLRPCLLTLSQSPTLRTQHPQRIETRRPLQAAPPPPPEPHPQPLFPRRRSHRG
ncbi:hypothetical protein GDO81_019104 [Engystomops pustulosus]|uniref:Uncharacterized protein n=1 Tax=Engystomops pustulosus TaxID=76066 RepID=A0AAV6YZ97_ENGPU|nr:hypothetical protein GDO81_019104 [Engystomops pustulosus]